MWPSPLSVLFWMLKGKAKVEWDTEITFLVSNKYSIKILKWYTLWCSRSTVLESCAPNVPHSFNTAFKRLFKNTVQDTQYWCHQEWHTIFFSFYFTTLSQQLDYITSRYSVKGKQAHKFIQNLYSDTVSVLHFNKLRPEKYFTVYIWVWK
jgi:hypothetical protein